MKRFTEYYTHTRYNLQCPFIWMPNNITLINWFEIIPHCSHCYIYNCPSLLPLSATYTSGLLWWMKINRLFLKNQQKHNSILLHAKGFKNSIFSESVYSQICNIGIRKEKDTDFIYFTSKGFSVQRICRNTGVKCCIVWFKRRWVASDTKWW